MKIKLFILFAITIAPVAQFIFTGGESSFVLPEKKADEVIYCVTNEYDGSKIKILIIEK